MTSHDCWTLDALIEAYCQHQRRTRGLREQTGCVRSVERRRVSSRVGRNMPEPIPVILLGQLAVDTDYQGRRLPNPLRQMPREVRQ